MDPVVKKSDVAGCPNQEATQRSLTDPSGSTWWRDMATSSCLCLSLFGFEAARYREGFASSPEPPRSTERHGSAELSPESGEQTPGVRATKSTVLTQVSPSDGYEAWVSEQRTIVQNTLANHGTPRLINGSTFLSPPTAQLLKRYAGQRSGDLAFREIDDKGYKFAFIFDSGERWFVSECPYYKDQFPKGLPRSMLSLQVCKAGAEDQIQREFPAAVGLSMKDGWINFAAMREVFRAAEDSRKSELADKAGAQHFDLTSNPIGYIALVDWNPKDPIVEGDVDHAKHFAELLNSLKTPEGAQRYTVLSHKGSEAIKVQTNPKETLRSFVRAMHRDGIRDFYLKLSGHGNEQGVWFTTPQGHLALSPRDLHAVFSEFRDSTFVVDTMACFGGGIAPQIRDYADPSGREGRVVIKLQTKSGAYNQEGRLLGQEGRNGSPKVHSTYYDIFNAYFLLQGHGIGKAHYLADEACKKVIRCDAEMWISGPKGGIKTADIPDVNLNAIASFSPRATP